MSLKTLILSSGAFFITTASFGASFQGKTQSDVHSHDKVEKHAPHAGYIKPGAAVALTHDYDGQTALGEFETLSLTLSHMYETGTLTIEVLPSPDVHIFSNLPSKPYQLSAGSVLQLPLQISGTTEGAYSVGIETIYEGLDGSQSRRVLSVPVTIGTVTTRKTQATKSKVSKSTTSKSTSNSYIALPVNEVIK